MHIHHAFIGLGSNLNHPVQQIKQACIALHHMPKSKLIQCSEWYQNPALLPEANPQPQPDYVNAVAYVHTRLSAWELLAVVQEIEQIQGRQRNYRWGPRTIDLDILLYDQQIIASPELTIPHPGISQRLFVLQPLCALNAEIHIPGLGKAQHVLQKLLHKNPAHSNMRAYAKSIRCGE